MGSGKLFAPHLAGSIVHRCLRGAARALERALDKIENWGNGNPQSNGEYFMIDRAARHWKLAFDIGANLGEWSERVASASPDCVINAFEASPRTFNNLKARFQSATRIQLHNFGVGERTGRAIFNDCGVDSGVSSFVNREATIGLKPEVSVEVPIVSVDDFCEERGWPAVDFIKVDTEGFEAPILRGMTRTLERRAVSAVQFEYGGTWLDAGELVAKILPILNQHGYGLYRLLPKAVEEVYYKSRIHESFKYSNYLAVRTPDVLVKWGIPSKRSF